MAQSRTVYRWNWVWNFDREEQWLNEMAMSGWVLCEVGFCRFVFERCEPGEYTIREELHPDDDGYVDFMEETGAEYIGRVMAWMYFRKKSETGTFDLFSDIDSRIAHLDRIGRMLTAVGAANLVIGIVNSCNSLGFGWINLLCATLLMYGLGRIHGKKESLEKDRRLLE